VTARQGRAQILHDSDINAYNSFDAPNRIIVNPYQAGVEAGRVSVGIPAMSIVTVILDVA
jgi:alpha-L-arabinofuranosidase